MKPNTVIVVSCTQSSIALEVHKRLGNIIIHDTPAQNISEIAKPEPIPFRMVKREDINPILYTKQPHKFHR